MITKENYITASFIDNDRKNIEVLLRDDKNEKVIPFIVEYNPEHPNCQDLLKLVDLDTLHENTYQKIQTEKNLNFDIEIDGGINFDNSKDAIEAGANILVSGTTIFKSNNGDIKKNIELLKSS